MKTFEERYTAWIDGRLTDAELKAFEVELSTHPEAEGDKESAHKLGELLRSSRVPALSNPDFFNHQLMARIAAEQPRPAATARERRGFSWSLGQVAWAGAFLLMLSIVVSQTWWKPGPPPAAITVSPAYTAQILSVRSADPMISATPLHSDKENVTVLWLDGLEYLPASYQLE